MTADEQTSVIGVALIGVIALETGRIPSDHQSRISHVGPAARRIFRSPASIRGGRPAEAAV